MISRGVLPAVDNMTSLTINSQPHRSRIQGRGRSPRDPPKLRVSFWTSFWTLLGPLGAKNSPKRLPRGFSEGSEERLQNKVVFGSLIRGLNLASARTQFCMFSMGHFGIPFWSNFGSVSDAFWSQMLLKRPLRAHLVFLVSF